MSSTIAQPQRHIPRGEDFLLLSPSWQAYAYANVDAMFATRRIARGTDAFPLSRGAEIAPEYELAGERRHAWSGHQGEVLSGNAALDVELFDCRSAGRDDAGTVQPATAKHASCQQ